MAKRKLTYNDLMELAKRYGVDNNVIFTSAGERYVNQVEMIEKIHADIEANGLMIPHLNVKGDTNMEINPLAVQLPKFVDAANKTLAIMLDIIQRLGTTAPAGDKLGEFLNE